jgi:uncharacterized protein involved in exopolysaccharide biosynthesis
MSMLNADPNRVPATEQQADLRPHYETVAIRTLRSIHLHWQLIVSFVVIAIVLACLALPLMPRKYSATAFVSPNLYSQEQGKLAPMASVDATSVVNGEARLILSDAALQAVVRSLGTERPEQQQLETEQRLAWLRTLFFPETRVESPIDREIATLRNKVEVAKDTRSYLISISFTASSADEAARIVNAVAVEYLRDKWIQRKRGAVNAAEGELARQLAVNGEKHPKVVQAADGLDAARADLKAFIASRDDGQVLVGPDEAVKLAVPNRTPTSPKGTVVLGMACMVGLMAGVSLAIWRGRHGLEPFDWTRQLGLRQLFQFGRDPAGHRGSDAVSRKR